MAEPNAPNIAIQFVQTKETGEKPPEYTIGVMLLDPIPVLGVQYLEIKSFDLTVTGLTIPARKVTKEPPNKKRGRREIPSEITPDQITPLVIFNLKDSQNQLVSLGLVLLPNNNILAKQANILIEKCVGLKQVMNGDKPVYVKDMTNISKENPPKLVYDLMVYTRPILLASQNTWEELQQKLANEKSEYEDRLKEARENFLSQLKKNNDQHKLDIKELQEENAQLIKQVHDLELEIPHLLRQKAIEFIKKLGNIPSLQTVNPQKFSLE